MNHPWPVIPDFFSDTAFLITKPPGRGAPKWGYPGICNKEKAITNALSRHKSATWVGVGANNLISLHFLYSPRGHIYAKTRISFTSTETIMVQWNMSHWCKLSGASWPSSIPWLIHTDKILIFSFKAMELTKSNQWSFRFQTCKQFGDLRLVPWANWCNLHGFFHSQLHIDGLNGLCQVDSQISWSSRFSIYLYLQQFKCPTSGNLQIAQNKKTLNMTQLYIEPG